jgi:hypothetical protein
VGVSVESAKSRTCLRIGHGLDGDGLRSRTYDIACTAWRTVVKCSFSSALGDEILALGRARRNWDETSPKIRMFN